MLTLYEVTDVTVTEGPSQLCFTCSSLLKVKHDANTDTIKPLINLMPYETTEYIPSLVQPQNT